MSDSQKPGSPDDPWEQLAEDLFGLEYGKEHALREPDSPPPSPQPIAAEEPVRHAEPVFPEREPVPEPIAEREPVAEHEPVSEGEDTAEAEFVFDEAEDVSESTESAPAEPVRTEPVSPQDSYWDALANWNWDESEGKGKQQSEPRSGDRPAHRGGSRGRDEGRGRRGGGERPQRSAPSPAAPSTPAPSPPSPGPAAAASRPPRTAAPSGADDFGLGVVGPEPGASPPAESAAEAPPSRDRGEPAEPARPAPETGRTGGHFERGRQGPRGHGEDRGPDEGHRKRRRRRRRRRRGEPGERGPAPGEAAVPGADWEDDDSSEAPAEGAREEIGGEQPARPERRGQDWADEPVSGAVGSAEVSFDDDEEEESQEIAAVGGASDEADLEDEGDDGSEEQTVSYENVPTWEEAISYLLHPNQVQVEGGSTGGGAPPRGSSAPGDQPRQTRHVGHRKHHRR